MKRLAYAIGRDRAENSAIEPPFARLAVEGLSIVHGPAPAGVTEPDLDQVRAYAEVVERLHARETILPLRYGCVLDSEAALADLLRRRRAEWGTALDEVEGCDEMGLRILLDADPTRRTGKPSPASTPSPSRGPGAAYLAERRARLAGLDAIRGEAARVEEAARQFLDGLHRQCLVEPAIPGRDDLLSIAFLIPRDRLDAFRLAARELEGAGLGRVLVTGPWPPYNFTTTADGGPSIVGA